MQVALSGLVACCDVDGDPNSGRPVRHVGRARAPPTAGAKWQETWTNGLIANLVGHSKWVIHEMLPELDALREQVESLWISDERFKDLEQAIATLAQDFYEGRAGHPIDSRSRPFRRLAVTSRMTSCLHLGLALDLGRICEPDDKVVRE